MRATREIIFKAAAKSSEVKRRQIGPSMRESQRANEKFDSLQTSLALRSASTSTSNWVVNVPSYSIVLSSAHVIERNERQRKNCCVTI